MVYGRYNYIVFMGIIMIISWFINQQSIEDPSDIAQLNLCFSRQNSPPASGGPVRNSADRLREPILVS